MSLDETDNGPGVPLGLLNPLNIPPGEDPFARLNSLKVSSDPKVGIKVDPNTLEGSEFVRTHLLNKDKDGVEPNRRGIFYLVSESGSDSWRDVRAVAFIPYNLQRGIDITNLNGESSKFSEIIKGIMCAKEVTCPRFLGRNIQTYRTHDDAGTLAFIDPFSYRDVGDAKDSPLGVFSQLVARGMQSSRSYEKANASRGEEKQLLNRFDNPKFRRGVFHMTDDIGLIERNPHLAPLDVLLSFGEGLISSVALPPGTDGIGRLSKTLEGAFGEKAKVAYADAPSIIAPSNGTLAFNTVLSDAYGGTRH